MTCKDCVHYEVCQYHIDEETDMTVTESGKFKNKADYVEVVRCKDCEFSIGTHPIFEDTMCIKTGVCVPFDHYCKEGMEEKKVTEEIMRKALLQIISGPHKVKKRKSRGLKLLKKCLEGDEEV